MAELKAVIAKNIAQLRVARAWTQIELAERLNYSDKAVSKWERAESVPDITVLKQIADLFEVSLDYLVQEEHEASTAESSSRKRNRPFITGISLVLVWLVATFVFVVLRSAVPAVKGTWYAFVYAVPVTMIVWLVFNSMWFCRKRNYLIISLLMWTVLAALYLSILAFSNIWLIFVLGIPGQIIIILWSRITGK